MTINQVIVECAKLDGYKQSRFGTEDAPVWYTTDDDGMIYDLPPYTTSRDSILPLIEKQEVKIQLLIIRELRNTLIMDVGCGTKEASLAVLLATPIQLCEALLRATKKW